MFVSYVTSCVMSVMGQLVICFQHFEILMTFGDRKMMPYVNLKNFGMAHFYDN